MHLSMFLSSWWQFIFLWNFLNPLNQFFHECVNKTITLRCLRDELLQLQLLLIDFWKWFLTSIWLDNISKKYWKLLDARITSYNFNIEYMIHKTNVMKYYPTIRPERSGMYMYTKNEMQHFCTFESLKFRVDKMLLITVRKYVSLDDYLFRTSHQYYIFRRHRVGSCEKWSTEHFLVLGMMILRYLLQNMLMMNFSWFKYT